MSKTLPKCYSIELENGKTVMKNKGISLKDSSNSTSSQIKRVDGTTPMSIEDYLVVAGGGVKLESVNNNLRAMKREGSYSMKKIRVVKDCLTGLHTKMIVTSDGSTCLPFIHGLNAQNYDYC